MNFINTITIIVFFLMSNISGAQEKKTTALILDLASIDPGQVKTLPGNRSHDLIILENCLIDKSYNIEISKEILSIDPLTAPNSSALSNTPSKQDPCFALNNAYNNLFKLFDKDNPESENDSIKTEKEISSRLGTLRFELKLSKCTDKKLVEKALDLIRLCQREIIESINVGDGEKITIKVKRDYKTWTWELVGEPVGKWVMSYGFGFCSSVLQLRTYHINQIGENQFQIKKDRKNDVFDLNYIPAIFYSFMPSSKFNRKTNFSVTSGLGFDLSAPVVFFGGGFMIYQNIGISAGLAFQQQFKIKPQYSENEILKTTLDREQLHDKIYRPNIFISINFRFDKNPFNGKDDSKKEK